MDAFEAEGLRQQAFDLLSRSTSHRQRLYVLKNYFSVLLSESSDIIADAFIVEFLDDFLECTAKFEVFFAPPKITNDVIDVLDKLKEHKAVKYKTREIESITYNLAAKLNELNEILAGRHLNNFESKKLHLPLLEKNRSPEFDLWLGSLETMTVSIKKSGEKDEFILVPSPENHDDELTKQVNKSWQTAIEYFRMHGGKTNKFHTVIISFDNRLGNYTGISLGAALTISFIEELINFYNFPYLISIQKNIAITGGFDDAGNLIPINENFVLNKLEVVFYSFINIFIVPEENTAAVDTYYNALKNFYPGRKLEIIGIKNLSDIFNRRNIIDIKKQSPVKRTARYAKKNWVVTALAITILLLSGYFYEFNFDDNPAILVRSGRTLFIENKSGRVLFTKTFADPGDEIPSPSFLKCHEMLVDINDNGKKDLIVSGELQDSLKNGFKYGSITCYNHLGKPIWNYLFQDTISSPGEVLSKNYASYIIDTATVRDKKVLVLFCCNKESFGSAIYMVDLKSGKRVFDTFWHPGFINGGYITRLVKHGEKYVVFEGSNNSWHKIAFGMLPLDNINGKAPSDGHHEYYGFKIASLIYYLLLPNEDYQKILLPKETLYTGIGDFLYSERDNSFDCNVYLSYKKYGGVVYCISKDFQKISIIINDDYARIRDPYVKSGKLKPPLSDIQEYRNLLINQIVWWNGKKFVKKSQLK